MNRDEGENRSAEKGRSGNRAALRAVVAAYLIYLGVALVRDMLRGESAMAAWVAWVCGVFFVLAGAVLGWYTWKQWRAKTAEKPAESPERQDRPED